MSCCSTCTCPAVGDALVLDGVANEHSEVRFLALSVSDAPEDVIAVIRAGARGYVTKTISGPELLAAIYKVAAGDAVFSPRLAGFVLDAFANQGSDALGRPPGSSRGSTTNLINCRPESSRCCDSSLVGTPIRKWPGI